MKYVICQFFLWLIFIIMHEYLHIDLLNHPVNIYRVSAIWNVLFHMVEKIARNKQKSLHLWILCPNIKIDINEEKQQNCMVVLCTKINLRRGMTYDGGTILDGQIDLLFLSTLLMNLGIIADMSQVKHCHNQGNILFRKVHIMGSIVSSKKVVLLESQYLGYDLIWKQCLYRSN